MKTTIEISRTSVQMALTTLTGIYPEGKKPLAVTLIETKVDTFLKGCPDHYFKFTIESSNTSSEGK